MPELETTVITVGDTRTCNVYGSPKDAKIIFDKHVPIPMRDGVEMMCNVFRPTAGGQRSCVSRPTARIHTRPMPICWCPRWGWIDANFPSPSCA